MRDMKDERRKSGGRLHQQRGLINSPVVSAVAEPLLRGKSGWCRKLSSGSATADTTGGLMRFHDAQITSRSVL
jgi:hypothetical protein